MDNQYQKWTSYFGARRINKVIRYLTLSDIMLVGSFGLITPIFAIFITQNIKGGNVEVAGLASAIYLLSHSMLQIPFATLIDRIRGERDDFWAVLIGSLIFSIIPLFYIVIETPLQLYLIQFIYGIAAAIACPAWYAIFTRHIDREHEAIEWGVYRTFTDFGGAITASVGGFIAYNYGFANLFVLMTVVSLIGAMFIMGIYSSMRPGTILFKDLSKPNEKSKPDKNK